jgi:hypothetical protein
MNYKFCKNLKIHGILITLCSILLLSCNNTWSDKDEIYEELNATPRDTTSVQNEEFAVEAPPFTPGIFPCTDCHAYFPPNPKRRTLVEFHDDISAIFDHDSENRWCLDCHDLNNRDSLRLASGKLLDFKESYKLCGQCHGEKYRDWKVGVHGKRTGFWNGKKEYLLCVSCHNPHSPRFKPLTPEPPPVKQEDIK